MVLCVCDWLTLQSRNLACDPSCSVSIYRGIGNLTLRISCASDTGASSSCLKFSYSGNAWYPSFLHLAIVYITERRLELLHVAFNVTLRLLILALILMQYSMTSTCSMNICIATLAFVNINNYTLARFFLRYSV